MYVVRRFSVRHARWFETLYRVFAWFIVSLDPVFRRIGYQRLERPVAAVEGAVKGALFDCKMCGQCALSSTGMSCSMNCPKNLRNGACGGVRPNGNCEVNPEMRCVWVEAWAGSQRMRANAAILDVQKPVTHSLKGTSSWLRVVQEKAAERQQPQLQPQGEAQPQGNGA